MTPLVLIFLLQVNKADTHVLWFSKKKKILFYVNKFYDVIEIRKKIDSCQNKKMCFELLKNKKYSFSFYFFLEIGWCFTLNKKWKKSKKRVSYSFSLKKYFWVI